MYLPGSYASTGEILLTSSELPPPCILGLLSGKVVTWLENQIKIFTVVKYIDIYFFGRYIYISIIYIYIPLCSDMFLIWPNACGVFSVRYDMTMARHVWSWTYRPNLNLIFVRYPCDQDFIKKKNIFPCPMKLSYWISLWFTFSKIQAMIWKVKGLPCSISSPWTAVFKVYLSTLGGYLPPEFERFILYQKYCSMFFFVEQDLFLVSMLNYQGWIYVGNLHVSQQLQWPFHTSLQASESRLGA